jgi:hypothetical protein
MKYLSKVAAMFTNVRWVPWAVIAVSLALGNALFNSQLSFADSCGEYCKARQVRTICHDVVTSKGLNGHQRDVEFEKCKVDPMTHKQIQDFTDDTRDSLD